MTGLRTVWCRAAAYVRAAVIQDAYLAAVGVRFWDRIPAALRMMTMPSPFVERLVKEAGDIGVLEAAAADARHAEEVASAELGRVVAKTDADIASAQAAHDAEVADAAARLQDAKSSAQETVSAANHAHDVAIAAASAAEEKLEREKDYLIASIKALAFDESADPTPAA